MKQVGKGSANLKGLNANLKDFVRNSGEELNVLNLTEVFLCSRKGHIRPYMTVWGIFLIHLQGSEQCTEDTDNSFQDTGCRMQDQDIGHETDTGCLPIWNRGHVSLQA